VAPDFAPNRARLLTRWTGCDIFFVCNPMMCHGFLAQSRRENPVREAVDPGPTPAFCCSALSLSANDLRSVQ
jgi:hypothetical protein